MRFIYLIIFLLTFYQTKAQQTPLYALFFKDQYLINPAAAGLKNYAVITINHRQQWRGIDGAPITNSIIAHLPVGKKVALGATIINDKRGLLVTNSFDAAAAYRLPLSPYTDHNIRFGLSIGVERNSFDISQLDDTALQDPVFINALDSHIGLRGKFGINYNYKSFNLGFSLPSLFESNLLSQNQFDDIVFDPLTNYLAFANIRLPMGDKLAFEPSIIYRIRDNGSQFEAAAIVHALDIVWLGASYRQESGINGLFGLTISDRIDFGYAYEMSNNQVNGFTNGTHELQLSIRVGKKKNILEKKQKKKPPKEEEPVVAPVLIVEDTIQAVKGPLPKSVQDILDSLNQGDSNVRLIFEGEIEGKIETITENIPTTDPLSDELKPAIVTIKGNHPFEINKGHYVVVGAYGVHENAVRLNDRLLSQGYDTDYGYSSDKKIFYVFILTEDSAAGARKKRDELRKLSDFSNAWYLEVRED